MDSNPAKVCSPTIFFSLCPLDEACKVWNFDVDRAQLTRPDNFCLFVRLSVYIFQPILYVYPQNQRVIIVNILKRIKYFRRI
ncbi:hypothetical protein M2443_002341 [Parabacteroides sp. PH5-16]|nr:hypothetical protein [Parabacteroides sp. PF5-13]MDH6361602.1 hypothetical protein [Parabacteroides sp. PH5-16]MDH6377269.1 hypothetical protein [Parabacteroides sp. PH5-33]